MRNRTPERTIAITFGIAPRPPADAKAASAHDPEVEGALKALGYVFDE
jgi:hypothetical protein